MRDFYLRWWCGNEQIVGIDFRDEMVLVAHSTTIAAAGEPPKMFAIPVPPGLIERGVIKQPVQLASILRGSADVSKLRGCRCGVVIPSQACFTACLDMPEELSYAGPSEAYAWALSRLSLDASTIHGKVYLKNRCLHGSRQLFLAATRLSVKEALEETCQALELELSCITLRSIALHKGARSFVTLSPTQATIWIDLTGRSPAVHIFEGDELRISCSLPEELSAGMGALIVEVCDQLGKIDGARYARSEIAAVCVGQQDLVIEFARAWKDQIVETNHHLLAHLDIKEIQTDDGSESQYLIAHGLAAVLRELG